MNTPKAIRVCRSEARYTGSFGNRKPGGYFQWRFAHARPARTLLAMERLTPSCPKIFGIRINVMPPPGRNVVRLCIWNTSCPRRNNDLFAAIILGNNPFRADGHKYTQHRCFIKCPKKVFHPGRWDGKNATPLTTTSRTPGM